MLRGTESDRNSRQQSRAGTSRCSGRSLSKNLTGVAIPVNADIPGDITSHFAAAVADAGVPHWCPRRLLDIIQ
jgi:hypothetical protein